MAAEHYIGIDVGTGSARACIVDESGEILAFADKAIKTWQPKAEYYEQSTQDIWRAICYCVKSALEKAAVPAESVKGLAFDATCSLTVFSGAGTIPVTVTPGDELGAVGPADSTAADTDTPNVILWLDHRPTAEAEKINATGHKVLKYVGGSMSVEMEVPKMLWLKNNMTPERFAACRFFDLPDALTHIATGGAPVPAAGGKRSFCSVICKQGYLPVGIDGSVKGWQPEFLEAIGLGELARNNFEAVGGVNEENGEFLTAGMYAGNLSAKAADELGLHTGVVVGSGVIDAYAGWIGTAGAPIEPSPAGQGKIEPSASSVPDPTVAIAASPALDTVFTRLAAVAGTSTCHLAMSSQARFVPGVWGPYRDVLFQDQWLAEGGQSATGELLRLLIDGHPAGADARKKAAGLGVSVYQMLNDQIRALAGLPPRDTAGAADAGCGCTPDDVASLLRLNQSRFIYPDFFGNRSPLADPNSRGMMVGLGSDLSSADSLALQYMAGLEAIALQTRQIVDRMNQHGHTIQSVLISGSLGQNEILNSLVATVCRLPVLIPKQPSAAVVHGAAMLGACAADPASRLGAAGAAGDGGQTLWKIMQKMTKPASLVWPATDPSIVKFLAVKYKIFLAMADSQKQWREWWTEAESS